MGQFEMKEPGKDSSEFIVNLIGLSSFLEQNEDLDTSLQRLATMVAKALETDNCSVMLLKESENDEDIHLRIHAHAGHLPKEAYRESIALDQGIAGRVVITGKSLLVHDIKESQFADVASRTTQIEGGFISTPLYISHKIIGVINVSGPKDGRIFSDHDLELANILSLFIGKSIQTLQLENLLKSKFAIAALAKSETQASPGTFTQEPERVAKILAKSFFREMKNAGMGPDHILKAATEIIGMLSETLNKHKKRENRIKSQE